MASLYNRELQESVLFELFKTNTFSDADKALKLAMATVNDKLLKVKDGTWTKKRLTDVKRSVTTEINKAYGPVQDSLNKELKDVAVVTRTNMLTPDYAKVPSGVLKEITTSNREIQGYTANELFKVTRDNHARQLNVILTSGVAQGKSVASISREMLAKNSKLTRGQLSNAIFTSVTEGRATVRHNSFKELEAAGVIKGYKYVAVMDSRTTEYCRNHDNRVYYKDIDEISSQINVHWHCRSVFAPVTGNDLDIQRASQFGPVDDESFGTWFAKQNSEFQKVTLGSKKFKAYQSGSYKIGGLPDVVGQTVGLASIGATVGVPFKAEHFDKEEGLGYFINEYTETPKALSKNTKLNDLFEVYNPNNIENTIYRGIEVTKANIYTNAKVGDIVSDKFPTSFSKSSQSALFFTKSHLKDRVNDSIYITMKNAKNQGFDIHTLSHHPMEEEILVAPNSSFKVVKKTKKILKDGSTRTNITITSIL